MALDRATALEQFDTLGVSYSKGWAVFNNEAHNFEKTKNQQLVKGCLDYQLATHKKDCLKYQIRLFIKGMGFEDRDSVEHVTAYLFNKVVHPEEKLEKLTPEDETWRFSLDHTNTCDQGWERFHRFLTKINENTWKTAEAKVQNQFNEYEAQRNKFEEKMKEQQKAFSETCDKIIEEIKKQGNAWLQAPRTSRARNKLLSDIKKIKDLPPLEVKEKVLRRLGDPLMHNFIPTDISNLIYHLNSILQECARIQRNEGDKLDNTGAIIKERIKYINGEEGPKKEEKQEKEKEKELACEKHEPPVPVAEALKTKEQKKIKSKKNKVSTQQHASTMAKVKAVLQWLWAIIGNLWNVVWKRNS